MKQTCCECGRRHRQCARIYVGQNLPAGEWVCILCWIHFDYDGFFTPDQKERLWRPSMI